VLPEAREAVKATLATIAAAAAHAHEHDHAHDGDVQAGDGSDVRDADDAGDVGLYLGDGLEADGLEIETHEIETLDGEPEEDQPEA
jgi:hypothetical protein